MACQSFVTAQHHGDVDTDVETDTGEKNLWENNPKHDTTLKLFRWRTCQCQTLIALFLSFF